MALTPSKPALDRRTFLTGTVGTVAAVGAGATLSGCTARTGSSSSASGSKTVTVMYASSEFTQDHITAFETQHPGYTIEFIEYDATRLNAMMTAGNPPDFARGFPSANNCARGLYAPIDEYLDASDVVKKDDLLAINDNFRWDGTKTGAGQYYGLVKDWSQDATLWQNTALFEKAGLDPLSDTEAVSWDDLLEIGKKLTVTKGGKTTTYGLGVEWAWGLASPAFIMVMQQGGSIYNADFTETDFTTAEAQRAMQWFVDLGRYGVAPTSLNPLPDGSDQSTFAAGKMGVTLDGYWFGGNFTEDADMQKVARMAPTPTFGTRISPSFNGGTGGFIPAKAKNKDGGWKVMEFFMGGDPAVERAKSGWGLPSLQSLWEHLPSELDYQKQAITTAKAELEYFTTLPDSPYVTSTAWISAIDEQLQATMRGKQSVQDACSKVTEEINKLLAQGKDQLG